MIALETSDAGGNCGATVTATILSAAGELPAGGVLLVLEEGDDVERVPLCGRFGLLTHLDDCWQQPFAWVRSVREDGARVFVARLAYGRRPVVVVAPDAPWLDGRLRLVLDLEAEESPPKGGQN